MKSPNRSHDDPTGLRPASACCIDALEPRRFLSASISGTVFNDLNASGARDAGEPALAGVRVYADLHNVGVYKPGDPNAITNPSGQYTIAGLSAGTYLLRQTVPAQFRQTLPGNGLCQHVTLSTSSSKAAGVNFGDTQKVRVSGFVYDDANGDGARDNGEGVLPGVTVYLDTNGNGKLDDGEPSTTTNSAGYFVIGDLSAGSYTVRVQLQGAYGGYVLTQPGGSGAVSVKLQKGQTADNLLFGLSRQVILLSASRSVSDQGENWGGNGNPYGKTQAVTGFSPFNGNVQFSADSGEFINTYGLLDDVTIAALATMTSSLSPTQITASGEVSSYEDDGSGGGDSYGQATASLTVTFRIVKAVSYQLSAAIDVLYPFGGLSGSVALTALSGANPVNTSLSATQGQMLSKSGVLAPGTYTVSESGQAYDNNDNGPDEKYSLSLKFN